MPAIGLMKCPAELGWMLVVGEYVGSSDADAVTLPVRNSEVTTVAVIDRDPVMIDVDFIELVVSLVAVVALPLPRVPPNGALGLMLFSLFSAAMLNALSVSRPWLITPTMPPWQWASTEQ